MHEYWIWLWKVSHGSINIICMLNQDFSEISIEISMVRISLFWTCPELSFQRVNFQKVVSTVRKFKRELLTLFSCRKLLPTHNKNLEIVGSWRWIEISEKSWFKLHRLLMLPCETFHNHIQYSWHNQEVSVYAPTRVFDSLISHEQSVHKRAH